MNKLIILIIAISMCGAGALFIFQGPAYPETQTSKLDDYGGSIIHGGLERTYRIHVPALYDKTKPVPLLIALHGGGGTGERMERLTLKGFNALSDKEGFVVVYPDGIEKHWNDGREKVRYRAHREKIDDIGFISALIDDLVKRLNIDNKRIYVKGISNGAMLSNRLACELSGRITAIAPVAGNMPYDLAPHCSPSKPISVLMISGTKDPMMPWEGGEASFGRLRFGRVLSVMETIKFWVAHNQCLPIPVITYEPDKDSSDGTLVRKEAYNGCKDGTDVILYAIENGGHTWPGGWQYLPEKSVGKISRDIDASEVIWSFFKNVGTKNGQ